MAVWGSNSSNSSEFGAWRHFQPDRWFDPLHTGSSDQGKDTLFREKVKMDVWPEFFFRYVLLKLHLNCHTYVYESVSYWDKNLKQPRSKRTLIGKRDSEGNIVPTGGRGRKKSTPSDSGNTYSDTSDSRKDQYIQLLSEKDAEIVTIQNPRFWDDNAWSEPW